MDSKSEEILYYFQIEMLQCVLTEKIDIFYIPNIFAFTDTFVFAAVRCKCHDSKVICTIFDFHSNNKLLRSKNTLYQIF